MRHRRDGPRAHDPGSSTTLIAATTDHTKRTEQVSPHATNPQSTGGRLPNTVALYSRPASAEGDGEVTVADLVRRASRRLNPTRVIVGGAARCAVRRFEQYGLGARPRVPPEAIAYRLAEAAPIILHLAGDESSEGQLRRYCTSIVEVTGLEEGRVTATELWSLDRAGLADTRPAPRPVEHPS